MNNSQPLTDSTCSSPLSSSPILSPMTDAVQHTACNLTCSPSNCTINTISPHTQFSPHQQPPHLQYIPQFDYQLHPDLDPLLTMASPYNYPNPNMTFFNPYMARSCKRALNTSGSSVGSHCSPHTKRPKHNLSVCSSSTNQSLISSCSNLNTSQSQLDLDKTWVPTEDLETSIFSSTGDDADQSQDCSNNNILCYSCPDLQPVVAVCRSCPDQPSLCQLCYEAHKRVRLTREHQVQLVGEQVFEVSSTPSGRSMSQVILSLIDLVDIDKKLAGIDLDESLKSTTAELVKTWSVTDGKRDGGKNLHDLKKTERIIKENLIPLFSKGELNVKAKVAGIIQTLIEIEVVNPTRFVDNNCIEGFVGMMNAEDSKVILGALDCLQSLVKEVARFNAKYSLIKLHSQLELQLKKLKDSEAGYTTSIQFKASRLIREMEKSLME
eukprot:GFUD01004332.1.p1 GENE.GFUD01004332.1~~GFUD01004332.1.p1  ORF type:complete len:437 (-),score=106.47 GFUD01004332.1:107-1417(-)